jgi:hypothetical protein
MAEPPRQEKDATMCRGHNLTKTSTALQMKRSIIMENYEHDQSPNDPIKKWLALLIKKKQTPGQQAFVQPIPSKRRTIMTRIQIRYVPIDTIKTWLVLLEKKKRPAVGSKALPRGLKRRPTRITRHLQTMHSREVNASL